MHEREREALVKTLEKRGISDERVLEAFLKVERHLFIPEALHGHAYRDNALPIGEGQTISQPYTVAFMTQALKLEEGDKVLEIGTGSGFQAAILEAMGMWVFSIERNYVLYQRTRKLFDNLNLRVNLRHGDGTIGWSEYMPYKGIIVTAGAPVTPKSLKKQLDSGGRLVVPVGDKKSQSLEIITRIDEKNYETESVPQFVFVPLIGREGWKQ